ncbi:MAG: hypothetical protein KGM42_16630, partial [Hyphomicrobiales bacterium]|nr:hypothetical protein [Hyphomicrobiales bacterium]
SYEQDMQARLSNGLDSATLSVAIARTNGQTLSVGGVSGDASLSAQVQQALNAALGPAVTQNVTTTASATVDASGAIASNATITYPTKFLNIFGAGTLTIGAHSQVVVPAGPIEVALALDTTGSMAGAKIAALQSAATSLTNTLFSIPNAARYVKVGVVPFTDYVNVGLAYQGASWLSNSQNYTVPATGSCTTVPNMVCTSTTTVNTTCVNDGVSSPCSYQNCTNWVQQGTTQSCPQAQTYTWNGCVGSRNFPADIAGSTAYPASAGYTADKADGSTQVPALLNYWCSTPLQRLTSDQTAVQTAINNLTAGGETYIAPGLLWGWRLLSPNTPFADGAAYGRASKYLILMTDGFNTHSPNYPDHEGADAGTVGWTTDTANANYLTAATCDAMKSTGIKVFTIAFQVSDPTIKGILQTCASSPSNYYDSGSIAALQSAFAAIGSTITAVRLAR